MLTKINIYNWKDISKLKIYRDEETGEYRRKTKCINCGEDLGCMCYSNCSDAIEDARSEWRCTEHYIKYMAHELEIYADIDKICGTNLEELEKKRYSIEQDESITNEEYEKLDNEIWDVMCSIIKNLTKEQCQKINWEIEIDYDDCYGYACDI